MSIAAKIPEEGIRKIINSTKSVLNDAVVQIEIINPEIISGEIRSFLKVHTSKPVTPSGHEIKVVELESKKTYYTDEQLLFE